MDPNNFQETAMMRFNHIVAKRNLKQRIQSRLNITYNNSYFEVTPELITFLSCWEDDELVLEDSYETPVLVNRKELLKLAKQRYQELMNEWQEEWEKLKKVRSAKNV